jgi:ClpP class serine protease
MMTCLWTSSFTHPGGLVLAALRIARAIRGHKAKVTVLVPHYAMSGGTSEIDDKTLILADVGRKAIGQLKDAAKKLLGRRLAAEQAEALAEKLSTGTWTHDYPIAADEARELGLPVSTERPNRVFELMALYPQPVHTQQGGVEYLPIPRQKEPTPPPL